MARGDLTDAQWERLSPHLPPQRSGRRGHPYKDHRTVIDGILWIDRTGAPWRDLPERDGSYQTCADRLYRWQRQGLWTQLLQSLQADQDQESNVLWEGCALDSTSIKAHPHAAGARHAPAQKGGAKRRPRNGRRPRRLRTGKPWDAVAAG